MEAPSWEHADLEYTSPFDTVYR